jgi:hypothetical protein
LKITEKLKIWFETNQITMPADPADSVYNSFTSTFTSRDVLNAMDVYIDTISRQPKESFDTGGALYATIVWILCPWTQAVVGPDTHELIGRIINHYGFTTTTVSPRSAMRKVLAAKISLRQAYSRADSRFGPVDRDLVDAIVCKLDTVDQVYELKPETLDAVLGRGL